MYSEPSISGTLAGPKTAVSKCGCPTYGGSTYGGSTVSINNGKASSVATTVPYRFGTEYDRLYEVFANEVAVLFVDGEEAEFVLVAFRLFPVLVDQVLQVDDGRLAHRSLHLLRHRHLQQRRRETNDLLHLKQTPSRTLRLFLQSPTVSNSIFTRPVLSYGRHAMFELHKKNFSTSLIWISSQRFGRS